MKPGFFTKTYHIVKRVQRILALRGASSEVYNHNPPQGTQRQSIVLVLSLAEGKAESKSHHLVATCFKQSTIAISQGILSIDVPIPVGAKTFHHVGEGRQNLLLSFDGA